MNYLKPLSLFILIVCFTACATNKLQIDKTKIPNNYRPDLAISHTMYAIGDAGNAQDGKPTPALKLLGTKLTTASKESSVVFLGDNIYPDGMPSKKEKENRADAEAKLDAQLDILKDFKGKSFFLPGNHDWRNRLKGLRRQEKYIEKKFDDKNVFIPDAGCGDPTEIELNENLTLVAVDSEWFLRDWDNEPEMNEGCGLKSKEHFSYIFEDAIKSNRTKNIIIACHHPLFSNGVHGGQYTVKQTIFPLTFLNKNLYIPIPFVGTFLRSMIGHRQDLANPKYKELKAALLASANKNGSFTFISGHEHNLQYHEVGRQSFIVSGAGSKANPARLSGDAQFVYGHQGFSQLDVYEDGSIWVKFWTPEGDGSKGKVVFEKQIKGPLKSAGATTPTSFPEFEEGKEFVEVPITKFDFSRGKMGTKLWGEHYREAYKQVIKAPVLDLSKFKGGVIPVKRGGGYQTNSLRIVDPEGQQYVMRSLDKDPTRMAPYPFNESFVVDVLRDNFSAAHPLAAFTVGDMAEVSGVLHTNPKLYYVPKQPALGTYNDLFGGGLYLIEERAGKDWSSLASFANSDKIISTIDVVDKVTGSHKHFIDEDAAIHARLFDNIIGDFDRHDDQWRWARIKKDGETIYKPIPRDRDQVYSHYDGALLNVLKYTVPFVKQLRPFTPDIPNYKRVNYHPRHFDRTFLQEASWAQWKAAAEYIKENLTDDVIEQSIKKLPDNVYNIDGEMIVNGIKGRRDKIVEYAREHYEFLAEKVDVLGTEKRDLFEVIRMDDNQTKVVIYDTNKKGEKEKKVYERIFITDETKEIILYGLGNDDIFDISGTVKKGIRIRVVAGLGEDTIKDKSKVGGLGKKTIIYDAEDEKTNLEIGSETKNKISGNVNWNTYNRRAIDYEFDYSFPIPILGYNADDGFLIGGMLSTTIYGFKKNPYSQSHLFSAVFGSANNSINIGYHGKFIEAIGKLDFFAEATYKSPSYAINYYGDGNNSISEEDERGRRYHRTRQRLLHIFPSIGKIFEGGGRVAFGPFFESSSIQRTEGRFIDAIGDQLNPDIFNNQNFLGAKFDFNYINVDMPTLPARGIVFNTNLSYTADLDNSIGDFARVASDFTFYQNIGKPGRLTLASRVGVDHIFNNEFQFFQGAKLGGTGPEANLRGFRRERFNGQTSFFHNTDLRLKLFNVRGALPFSMGIFGGVDYGRVWSDKDDSTEPNVDDWHYAYGGGIYLSPFDIMAISVSMFRGDNENNRFVVRGGFFF